MVIILNFWHSFTSVERIQLQMFRFCTQMHYGGYYLWTMPQCGGCQTYPHALSNENVKWCFRDILHNGWPIVCCHPERLCLSSWHGFASPQSAHSSWRYDTLLFTRGTVVVHPCCGFSLRRQMVPQQTAKFWPASFRHFRSTLRKDSVANRFGRSFRLLLEDCVYFTTPTSLSSVGRWRHKIRKFAVEIFQNAKKSMPQSCAKYFVWLLSW